MKRTDFFFDLPSERIAQEPCQRRDHARMLVLDRTANQFSDHHFFDLPRFLRAGDLLVMNNTKVFPARLVGVREGFPGKIEVFLIRELAPLQWEALVKPGRRLKPGTCLSFGETQLRAVVADYAPGGRRLIHFELSGDLFEVLDRVGQTPLPPYIRRTSAEAVRFDRETYQTVYARERGAVAAPTAGLHFTPEILHQLHENGIETAELTLHVGYGTFQPVEVEEIENHKLEGERYAVPRTTADRINAAKREGRRVIAVGTTSTRTLEAVALQAAVGETVAAGSGVTDLLITPGFRFQVLDGLITNFHLPCSSLLALVSAFGGYELVMNAYRHAVQAEYRFYSYGDCMLIV
ncbi:MAG: tRNA preQ1(34) S-adenosylmethionine ribosyltransferase-isomerase QueA [Blastocatellia bacterium]|nr:tRNA preQ1(34) S-adenosylmethionine ribosyltransferase-isomerase QueA [Blastocatellia bacterium]